MKTSTKIAVAFVALAGVAGAALSAQADSRWQGRDGGPDGRPGPMMQQAYGGHGMQGGGHHGKRHGGGHDSSRHDRERP